MQPSTAPTGLGFGVFSGLLEVFLFSVLDEGFIISDHLYTEILALRCFLLPSPGSGRSNATAVHTLLSTGTKELPMADASLPRPEAALARHKLQTGTALLKTQSAPAGLHDISGLYLGQALTFQTTFWQML